MHNTTATRLIATAAGVALAVGLTATPADAAPPRTDTTHVELDGIPVATCDGNDIVADFRLTETTRTGRDGATEITAVRIDAILTNTATGLEGTFAGNHLSRDEADGTTDAHGLSGRLTVRGRGTTVLGAGTVVFETDGSISFRAGAHRTSEDEAASIAAICEALA